MSEARAYRKNRPTTTHYDTVLPMRIRPGLTKHFVALWLLLPGSAKVFAQFTAASRGLAMPAVSWAAPDDATAIATSPASLAFTRGYSLHVVHVGNSGTANFEGAGTGFYFATPLLFGSALGASVEHLTPLGLAGGAPRTLLSLGLAYAPNSMFSLGVTGRHFLGDVFLRGVTTLDASVSYRPLPALAMSLTVRDLNNSGYALGTGSLARTYVLSLGVRPVEDERIGFEASAGVSEIGDVGLRAQLEWMISSYGRLAVAGQAERIGGIAPDFQLTASTMINWENVGVGGGVIVGDGLGDGATSPAYILHARLEDRTRVGLPSSTQVLDVHVGGGERGLLQTLLVLDRAHHSERISGVILRPSGSGIGLAAAQELRYAIDQLAASGKRVLCVLEDASGAELYACANAARTVVDPAGGVRLYGPVLEVQHVGSLLANLGVRADFVRIGAYKGAIEQLHNDHMSAAAREARGDIVSSFMRRLRYDLGQDWSVSEDEVLHAIEGGPYVAEEAVRAGLVRETADPMDLAEVAEDVLGSSNVSEHIDRSPVQSWGRASHIAVVMIDGDLTDGQNTDIPVLEIHTSGGHTVAPLIDRLAADPSVAAIVLRLDTPGGSVLAADQIWRAVMRARRRKPVIASMGSIAASGGYYIAAAADEIWADPSTLTGSIGVWFGKVDFQALGLRIGLTTEQIRETHRAGAESLWRPFSPDEREVLADKVRLWYRTFLQRVARGRGMTIAEVDRVARGRVWTGDAALEHGLVDHLGGVLAVLARVRELAHLSNDAAVQTLPRRPSSLAEYVVGDSPILDLLGARASSVDANGAAPIGSAGTLLLPQMRSAWIWMRRLEASGGAVPVALAPFDPPTF